MHTNTMMNTRYYCVADHLMAITAPEKAFEVLSNYAPFEIPEPTGELLLHISVSKEERPSSDSWEHVYTDRSDEDMPRIEMYRREEEWLLCVSVYRDAPIDCAMRCSADWHEVTLYPNPANFRFAVDNAAMLVFAFATADRQTLLFHSSVTVREGKAYMFLGHSGTGKSTHSRQWLTAFEDAWLLNDDNPAVRLKENGEVWVYGTPWSGKTACYKNEKARVQALVQLAQAPENKIVRLRMTQAYPYILSSVSGLKVQPQMMDRLYESIAKLLELTPVYRLECLPEPSAAQLCAQTCSL